MEAKNLVLQRDEPITFDGSVFDGIFGNREEAARLRNRLEQVSLNHKIHVGTIEPHAELPLHIREMIGTWHKGEVLRQRNGKTELAPGRGYGHTHNMPKP